MARDNYYVMCPFYKKDESVTVRCEGPIEDTRLVLQFGNKAGRERYQDKFCKTDKYKECRICKMLEEKYP